MTAEVTFTRSALQAIQAASSNAYKFGLKNVSTVTLQGGETLAADDLLVLTCYYDDQRDGEYTMRYLIGSSLTGGKALALK